MSLLYLQYFFFFFFGSEVNTEKKNQHFSNPEWGRGSLSSFPCAFLIVWVAHYFLRGAEYYPDREEWRRASQVIIGRFIAQTYGGSPGKDTFWELAVEKRTWQVGEMEPPRGREVSGTSENGKGVDWCMMKGPEGMTSSPWLCGSLFLSLIVLRVAVY